MTLTNSSLVPSVFESIFSSRYLLSLQTRPCPVDRQHLVDQLDENGYLQGDCAETADRLGTGLQDVEHVLQSLQTLDPPRRVRRSLAECLAIQLQQKDRFDPAMQALIAHLDLLAKRVQFAAEDLRRR